MASSVAIVSVGACRSNSGGDIVRVEVGPNGGTVSSSDSVLTIAILPDALDETIEVIIERSDEPARSFGPAYRVQPNPQLAIPATVTYRYPLPEDTSDTAIGWVDPEEYAAGQGQWHALPVVQLDTERDLVTGLDPQISLFYALLDESVGTGVTTNEPTTTQTPPDESTTGDDGLTTTTNPTNPTDPSTTTDPTTTDPATTDATDATGSTDTDGGEESSGTDTGMMGPCEMLPAGPLAPVEFMFDGSPLDANAEDLTFSSIGSLIARNGADLVRIDPAGTITNIPVMTALPDTLGLRWTIDGNIVTASRDTGELLLVEPVGTVTQLWGGLGIPNGIYTAIDGNVFFTDFTMATVTMIDAAGTMSTEIGAGGLEAPQPNGIVYDPDRDLVYYVSYGPGILWQVDVADLANPGDPVQMLTIAPQGGGDAVGLDGLAMDECGNLYIVDQNGSEAVGGSLFRVILDAAGDAVGDPEMLVEEFDANVANAVFGQGPGWEAFSTTLFLVGLPGRIFMVDVGVEGAPTAVTG